MNIDFTKGNGLIPVIIQNAQNLKVLMLGYMNEEAYHKTINEKVVTFFSRSKNRLWTKGETSGNFLIVEHLEIDCDNDSLLIKVNPTGPTCHTGSETCFKDESAKGFLFQLEKTIEQRIASKDEKSYTFKLFERGMNKMAQKVGEEAVELVIEAKDDNINLFKNEAADLMYHFLILLKAKNVIFEEIESVLKSRMK
jgi:phosphoribosyl-AMP cyclohydrolase / phosphoribosyl-ATP pyrophosphohydrolase